jgi:succinyl-CoA synthetase beta subunit
MARKKLSEFRAKTLLYEALGLPYAGESITLESKDREKELDRLPKGGRYVVKVDQGVKGRFKKDLVKLNVPANEVAGAVAAVSKHGFRSVLVEPYLEHEAKQERYLALTLEREGTVVSWSRSGGVDVEQQTEGLRRMVWSDESAAEVDEALGLKSGTVAGLEQAFEANYMSFLEINPLVVTDGVVWLLDAAVEVDEEAAPLVHERWTLADFREARKLTPQETAVLELAAQSQASFRLEVLNPDGAVFLLLSGGGASVVLADEVFNQGSGEELGNYGEYSGNPNEEETYLYTKQIVSLLLTSKGERKVLVIGGGVANFTDVRVTFRGVIRALRESEKELQRQQIRVFVRRGGPFEKEGLARMRAFLDETGLLGEVAGPELMLAGIVTQALAARKAEQR